MATRNFITPLFGGFNGILILLILIAGTNKHVLPSFFFLETNTANVNVPSTLSNSTFLQDISSLQGNNDLVGFPATTTSLGLTNSYTISLFTFCGTNCSGRFGFHFDPLTDLKLDETALQGSFDSKFSKTLSAYAATGWFLGIAYVLAFLFNFSTIVLSSLSSPYVTAITSSLTTIFLLTASGASVGIFIKVKGSFNSALSSSGIQTALGNRLSLLSWIATVASLMASIICCIHAHRSKTATRKRDANGLLGDGVMDKGGNQDQIHPRLSRRSSVPGFLKKMPTWNRHKYAQVDEGTKRFAVQGKMYNGNDAEVLITRGFGGGEEGDFEEPELVRGSMRGIQLQPIGNGLHNRVRNTAYEPFRAQAL